jgi:hypothetical protein
MTTSRTVTGTDPGTKSAAEVEREVRESRARVERTLDQIQERLSPGELIDQAVTYFRHSGGSEFARNLGDSVKHNPMPVALVAVGLAWMMMSGRRADDDGYDRAAWDEGYGSVEEWDDELVGGGPEASPLYETGYAPFATDATERWNESDETAEVGDDHDSVGDQAREGLRRARHKADELVDRARDAARGAADEVGAKANAMAGRARAGVTRTRHGFRDAGAGVARYGRRARRGVLETFYEQPLVLGALGLAVGAAIGAAVPASAAEDSVMGEAGDRIKRDAERVGREQLAKARATAGAAVEAGRAEAERQGLTAEGAKGAARTIRDKVEQVAEAAADAARDQADQEGLGRSGGSAD